MGNFENSEIIPPFLTFFVNFVFQSKKTPLLTFFVNFFSAKTDTLTNIVWPFFLHSVTQFRWNFWHIFVTLWAKLLFCGIPWIDLSIDWCYNVSALLRSTLLRSATLCSALRRGLPFCFASLCFALPCFRVKFRCFWKPLCFALLFSALFGVRKKSTLLCFALLCLGSLAYSVNHNMW